MPNASSSTSFPYRNFLCKIEPRKETNPIKFVLHLSLQDENAHARAEGDWRERMSPMIAVREEIKERLKERGYRILNTPASHPHEDLALSTECLVEAPAGKTLRDIMSDAQTLLPHAYRHGPSDQGPAV
jgi:hypothetical protein